ncbi:MAG: RimK family protein [Thiogranum sp.]|nr:RimK family protein [Thiogranum sp.]
MTKQLVVVENLGDWNTEFPDCQIVHVDEYLTRDEFINMRNVQVINLCRSYKYQSVGYYCSLLAEARRHRVLPSVKTILDLSSKAMYGLDAEALDALVARRVVSARTGADQSVFLMDIFFGHCQQEGLQDLARQIFETFPCPLLQVEFQHQGRWRLNAIKSMSLHKLNAEQKTWFGDALTRYQKSRWRTPRPRTPARYDLAILYNPEDKLPPSDARALNNFIKAGKVLGIDVDLIQRKDYSRLAEYDALFIRDTTKINHYTYRFAKKAESEDMVVMDDPTSILRCTNKVYLAELLRTHNVPTPKTLILHKQQIRDVEQHIPYPIVLKVPDGSFSRGVCKVENREQLMEITRNLFKESELILAQEFLYTAFDWRIGILNREPLYACQYFMSKSHWQIVNHGPAGRFTEGGFKTFCIEEAPPEVVAVALKAANLIGDGFYGVDVKSNESGVFVIEVNDNPSIDGGVEDCCLKSALYERILREFVRRLDQRRGI